MSKSLLYAVNTNSQNVAIDGVINFGQAVRRYGCNCNISGGNVVLSGTGYYNIDTNINVTFANAGVATIQLYKDGVIIPGGLATLEVTATPYNINIPAVVRETCCCDSTITAVVTGVAGTISTASIIVEKL